MAWSAEAKRTWARAAAAHSQTASVAVSGQAVHARGERHGHHTGGFSLPPRREGLDGDGSIDPVGLARQSKLEVS